MSKKPQITEGGIARMLGSTDRLRVPLTQGGMSLWIPEDIVSTKAKSVTQNGIYFPIDDDCYGYRKVTANVRDTRVKGKGADGNDYVVDVDENGDATIRLVPSAIKIVLPPNKRNYAAGEDILFAGLWVVLLRADGGLFKDDRYPNGTVPHKDLTFPVTVADPSGAHGSASIEDTSGLSDETISAMPFDCAYTATVYMDSDNPYKDDPRERGSKTGEIVVSGESPVYAFLTETSQGNPFFHFCSKEPFRFDVISRSTYVDGDDTKEAESRQTGFFSYGTQINGKDVYWSTGIGVGWPTGDNVLYPSLAPIGTSKSTEAAYVILYGTVDLSGVEVPVNYESPYTGDTFTDTFTITVAPGAVDSGGWQDMGDDFSGSGGGNF